MTSATTSEDNVSEPDYTGAYRGVRERISALIEHATPEQLSAIAPATPEWRVHDVLAHLVGATADVLAGRLDGVASDAWTEAQVEPRRDLPTAALIEEWETNAETFEPMIPAFGPASGQVVLDAATHEHDIRDAFGTPGARVSDAVGIGSMWMAEHIGAAHSAAGHGTLRIETDLWARSFGADAPASTLRVSAFELLRASTGRRSSEQVDAFTWEGPAHPELIVAAIFRPRAVDFDG